MRIPTLIVAGSLLLLFQGICLNADSPGSPDGTGTSPPTSANSIGTGTLILRNSAAVIVTVTIKDESGAAVGKGDKLRAFFGTASFELKAGRYTLQMQRPDDPSPALSNTVQLKAGEPSKVIIKDPGYSTAYRLAKAKELSDAAQSYYDSENQNLIVNQIVGWSVVAAGVASAVVAGISIGNGIDTYNKYSSSIYAADLANYRSSLNQSSTVVLATGTAAIATIVAGIVIVALSPDMEGPRFYRDMMLEKTNKLESQLAAEVEK